MKTYIISQIASWRNWIARMTSDHKVGGSSPSGVEFFFDIKYK